jgi:phosphoglycerol transferase
MRRSVRNSILGYGLALIASLVLVQLTTHLLSNILATPPYAGDNLWTQAYIKGLISGDWLPFTVPHSLRQGAPFGFRQTEFPMPEGFLQLILKAVGLFTNDSGVAVNVFYVLGFPLSCLSFVYLARRFRMEWMSALSLGLLFSFLPYHFNRLGHLFLASYFFVPLFALAILWIWKKAPLFQSRRDPKSWGVAGICLLAAGGGVYYAFFFCIFAALSAVGAAYYRKSRKHLLAGMVVVGLVGFLTGLNLFPYALSERSFGKSPYMTPRSQLDTETYGLRITRMLLPRSDHRLPFLAKLSQGYQSALPVTEADREPLGAVPVLGLAIVTWGFFFLPRNRGVYRLGLLVTFAMIYFTVAGGASVFSLLVSPQIRAVNRVSIFIATFALLGLGLELMRLKFWMERRGLGKYFAAVPLGLLVLGTLDQVAPAVERPSSEVALYQSDQEFVRRLEERSDQKDGRVFQLPHQDFPEAGAAQKMDFYSHFAGYLFSDKLGWSYGAVKGRPESEYLKKTAELPVSEMLKRLALMGYTGLWIDRRGYEDRAAELESELAVQLNQMKPENSQNGNLIFYSLHDYSAQLKTRLGEAEWSRLSREALTLVEVRFSVGFYGPDQVEGTSWSRKNARLEILNSTSGDQRIAWSAIFRTHDAQPSGLEIAAPDKSEKLLISSVGTKYERQLVVKPGRTVIQLKSEAAPWIWPSDGRSRYFELEDLRSRVE